MHSVRTMKVLVTGNERVRWNKRVQYSNRTVEGMRPCRELENVAYTSRNWRVHTKLESAALLSIAGWALLNCQRSSQTILTPSLTISSPHSLTIVVLVLLARMAMKTTNPFLGTQRIALVDERKSCIAHRDHCLGGWIIKSSRLSFRFPYQLNTHIHLESAQINQSC